MTHYGINPSFCTWSSRLPLFADFVRRGRMFEAFTPDGFPTGMPCAVGPDGWPSDDGLHGVRVFGDMAGTMPPFRLSDPTGRVQLKTNSRESLYVYWRGPEPRPRIVSEASAYHGFDEASLRILQSFRPAVLRTLDWQRANERPDWSRPRVSINDPLQGTDRGMAVELQAEAANLLGAHLWWNAPPRYELTVDEYEARLEELLVAIRDTARKPPILELGNELWNAGFPVHGWLKQGAGGESWQMAAAAEIVILKRVADRVLGTPALGKSWYLFVGGHLATPSTLDRVLGALPHGAADIAGPAVYVGPVKASSEAWEATGAVPGQVELENSCRARMLGVLQPLLDANCRIAREHGARAAVYEAGQSMNALGHPWRAAALAAQREEWMGGLYRDLRSMLESSGVELACWYSLMTSQSPPAPTPAFGLLEGVEMAELPKATAARGQ